MTPDSGTPREGTPLPDAAEYLSGLASGDRRAVAKTITLLESTRDDHAAQGQEILEQILPRTGRGWRVGITGTPGVGKSTLIEVLGLELIERGHRVAVLAVDPSSPVSGGSILGDKTRMERLAMRKEAFIRPTPSGGSLGGVAHRTREAMLVCEAAGFDVVLIETVGIGQSEFSVASMVDFFAVLLQPGAGDSLQGIKKGVLELAHGLVVTKADGDQKAIAQRTRVEHEQALQLLHPKEGAWKTQVLSSSALKGEGIAEFWSLVEDHRKRGEDSGERERIRAEQNRDWMWTLIDQELARSFRNHSEVARSVAETERQVAEAKTTPAAAARSLLQLFRKS